MTDNDTIAREHIEGGEGNSEHDRSPDWLHMIQVGNEALEFRELGLSDPVPTGRQIIEAAGFRAVEEFLIFEVSRDRRLTELKLDETTDLRGRGKERFIIFKSDRSWRGIIDGKRFEWGARDVFGHVLKWLAGVDPDRFGVWLERKDEPDLLIADDEKASLMPHGVERFRTDRLFKICIEGEDLPWDSKTITTEQIAGLGGWDPSLGVIEVDEDQNERTLEPGEVIKLRPGVTYGKKLCFKRGRHE
ncbi:MAG: multiubiquitin domain-containing protein [Kiloniellales bacterium]|nr:multiubiquitin domain-containing protein [Kiloniellales bacterium]